MSETEFELEQAYDRSELAAVFREFATTLESGHTFDLHTEGHRLSVDVPSRVVAELEAEHDADESTPISGIEFELEWDDPDGSTIRVDEAADPASDREADPASDPEGDVADARDDVSGTDGEDISGTAGDEGVSGDDETTDGRSADPATAAIPPEAVTREAEPSDADGTGRDRERTSRFEVYEDRGGEWRWRLVHWNGNIVADSGEGYTSRSNAERAARSVMRSAPTATVERLEG